MRILFMILFFLIVLAAQAYTSVRLWQVLPVSWLKWTATAVYNLSFVCLILFGVMTFTTGKIGTFGLSTFIYEMGTSYVFVLLYATILFGLCDLLRLVHVLPKNFLHENWVGTITTVGLLFVVFLYGNIHYKTKYKETLTDKTEKAIAHPLKVIFLSDLHLGYHNQRAELARWIDILNAENPDLILTGGDIIDFSVTPLLEQDMAEEFHRLKAPVFACLGNHEYLAGVNKAMRFYESAGINLLKDGVAQLSDLGIVIIGRDDRSNPECKPLSMLMKNVTEDQYTFVLDHQPYHLEEAEACGVDYQLSGHTHYGQVWPITWLIDAMYEDGYGAYQKGNTHYYVSSGMGIWGGKFRIGTRSEYVVLEVSKK